MSIKDLQDVFYPIIIHKHEDDEDSYYIAHLPDFGISACSAIGETPEEAVKELEEVKKEVIEHFVKTKKKLPSPSITHFQHFSAKIPVDNPYITEYNKSVDKDCLNEVEKRQIFREETLKSLGFEEVTDKQRKENLAQNLFILELEKER